MEGQYLIEEMTWQEFDRRRQEIHTVILPMGAVECYGPHLPMSSDTKVARAIAGLVAQRTGALVAPPSRWAIQPASVCFPAPSACVRRALRSICGI